MGCGKSKLNAVATGNTTTISDGSKRSSAAENSNVVKSSSKKLKAGLSKKNMNMESLSQKAPDSVASKAKPELVVQAEEGKGNQGGRGNGSENKSEDNGGTVAMVEVKSITKDREPKGGEKKEVKQAKETKGVANGEADAEGAAGRLLGRDSESKGEDKEEKEKAEEVGVANSEENMTGAAGTVIGGDLMNQSSDEEAKEGIGSEVQLESSEIVKAEEDIMEEKSPFEKTKAEKSTQGAGDEAKAPAKAIKEANSTGAAGAEAKAPVGATEDNSGGADAAEAKALLKEKKEGNSVKVIGEEAKAPVKETEGDNSIKEAKEEAKADEKYPVDNEENTVTSAAEEKKTT